MELRSRIHRLVKPVRDIAATAVLASLLTVVAPAVVPHGRAEAAAGNQVSARVAVNLRSGPGTSYARIGVLYRGQSVTTRGAASNGWVPVTWQGRDAWVAAAYVTSPPASAPAPGTAKKAWTTVRLNVRSAASLNGTVLTTLAKGTEVSLTGTTSGQWSQISWNNQAAWVASRYLSATPATAAPAPTPTPAPAPVVQPNPIVIGTRWGTVALNLWHSATSRNYAGEAPKGAEFAITGNVQSGRAEVVYQGAVRWVTAKYLSEVAPNRLPTTPQTCLASHYGSGHTTANGERFDPNGITAAHKSLPFGTKVTVTNRANGKSVVVRINDRGPYVPGRCLDLSTAAFAAIADPRTGVIRVTYQITS